MTTSVLIGAMPYLIALAVIIPLSVWGALKLIPSDNPPAKAQDADIDPSYHDDAGHYGKSR